ncbi:superfamily II DNA or RNA helicase [Microvirga lupini]|uniref:Superfamily II DNA or RNA helicase n=2 Tax=Microvirga lupini TaxID=420324 RepID=A0A7W4YV84_9HYPH|nr:superfamily II DNA or RNA helicase [Microvirga lupini]
MAKALAAFQSGKKRPLVVAATGAGKTVVFSCIAQRASAKGNKVLILAHRDQLIKQASGKLRDYEVQHGIIMAGFTPNPNAKVQVASVQTLVRRLKKMRFIPDLIIIDEAHLSAAKSYIDIINHFSKARVLGFTGSPCRLDGKPLGADSGGIYDDLIQAITIRQLIDRGFLVQPKVYGAPQEIDLTGIKKSMGDYNTEQLAEAVDKPRITGDAIAQYKKICPGAPAVAWCVTVQHAQHVADEFNAAGIKAVMLCGEHDTAYRDAALRGLETGEIQVVTFVGILVEGVDCPAISAIILLRPTMSLSSYLQVIGRGLRPYTNAAGVKKEVCYVLDHASLWRKHGFADEEREWDLNGEVKLPGKKKDKEKGVDLIQCGGCFAVFEPAPVCPNCGKPVETKARKLDQVDGELVEITAEMREAVRKDKQREVKGAKTLEELQRIAAQRGYSPGWAKATFEARKRTREKYRPARPKEPSMAELQSMTLEQLERVANEQGWPRDFPSEFFYTKGAGAQPDNNQQTLGGF